MDIILDATTTDLAMAPTSCAGGDVHVLMGRGDVGIEPLSSFGGGTPLGALTPDVDFPILENVATAGANTYAILRKADTPTDCRKLVHIPDYPGCASPHPCVLAGDCFSAFQLHLGNLQSDWIDAANSCGFGVGPVNDLVVVEGGSSVNPSYNEVVLALNGFVFSFNEGAPMVDQYDTNGVSVVWEGDNVGSPSPFAILPPGPFTSVARCGGYLYVGTQSNGIAQIESKFPGVLSNVFQAPLLPTNTIRELDCSDTGPVFGEHRLLAATPAGAVELVLEDAPP